jgi:phosphoglycerate kinase
MVARMRPGQVILLENLRFHHQEMENDPLFARQLAALAEVYIDDAFSAAHRAHASTEGVAHYFPQAVAGDLMIRELDYLGRALVDPVRPFAAILGGAKISDKIGLVRNLLPKVDMLLVGGGMAFTFLKAQGLDVGASLVDVEKVELAREILQQARDRQMDLQLPSDCVIASEVSSRAQIRLVSVEQIPAGWIGVDIGPQTLQRFVQKISSSRTILWNGPMGVFEIDQFAQGTYGVARALAEVTDRGGVTIIGGGDSAAAVARGGFQGRVSHISTGGGASLEFLAGKALPGVEVLTEKSG